VTDARKMMIISPKYKFVFIGIPRTGSKSMNRWLIEQFGGIWYRGHHDYNDIPDGATGFLRFAVVRNPYDRAVSGYFARVWGEHSQRDELRVAVSPPSQEDLNELTERKGALSVSREPTPYRTFVEGGNISLLLYFERLPGCLSELPFSTGDTISSFPHVLERGIRPDGRFADFFDERYEKVIWNTYRDDFLLAGYQRYDDTLPAEAPNAIWLSDGWHWSLESLPEVPRTLWNVSQQHGKLRAEELSICREIFEVQAKAHPDAIVRGYFERAVSSTTLDRNSVAELATFSMDVS